MQFIFLTIFGIHKNCLHFIIYTFNSNNNNNNNNNNSNDNNADHNENENENENGKLYKNFMSSDQV